MYTDKNGNASTVKMPAAPEFNTNGLVIYVLQSKSQPDTLEFHIAWEIQLGNAPIKVAYIDAVTGETIAIE